MKTMWFTFLYSSVIPFGTICSCIGLVFYYWADKYNLIKKFTAKENISLDLTVSMIDLLDFIVIWHAIGDFYFKYKMQGYVERIDIILLCCAALYNFLMCFEWSILDSNS